MSGEKEVKKRRFDPVELGVEVVRKFEDGHLLQKFRDGVKRKVKGSKVSEKLKELITLGILWNMIKKDFKLILRSKSSSLIVVLGPLLLILLVGAAFNTSNLSGIIVGAYSGSYSALTDSILDEIKEKQFNVVKYDSSDNCVNDLKNGQIHVCAVFPADLKVGAADKIKFYVDSSRINLVYTIIDSVSTGIGTKSEELSLQLTKNILDTLDETKSEILAKQDVVSGLSTSNQELSKKSGDIIGQLTSLDLAYEDTGLSAIKAEVEKIEESNNFSTDLFDDLYKLINQGKNATKNIQDKLSSASLIISGTNEDLSAIQGNLGSDLDNLRNVETSFRQITQSINNLEITSAEKIVSPINMEIESVVASKKHLNYLFPTLIVLVIMFIAVLLSSNLVVREKTSSAYFRNFITPAKDWLFVLGEYLTNLVIVALQMLIIFIVAMIFFKEIFAASTVLVLFLIASLFILLGMLIGYIFKSEETSSLGAISVASILLFFSNTILPIESLPSFIKKIADYNPFVLSENALKEVVLFGISLKEIYPTLIILAGISAVLAGAVYGVMKLTKRRA